MSKVKLQKLLTQRLGLVNPVFRLERIGSKIAGSIISDTFKGKSSGRRQSMLRDAIEAELDPKDVLHVGTLLAYTPEEWNIELPAYAG